MSNQEEKSPNQNKSNYYTYLILDPRIKGTFIYDDGKLVLEFLPIYVGKGCGYRCNVHLSDAKNTIKRTNKLETIREILRIGLKPIIIKVLETVTEKESLAKEKELVWVIGRADLGMGTLTNLTWGGEGCSGNKIEELIGRSFGRLVVEEFYSVDEYNNIRWVCRCECGGKITTRGTSLRDGATRSCGCLKFKHGKNKTPEHRAWIIMKQRCYNSNIKQYKDYGGRGIIICDEWLGKDGFFEFL